MIWETTIGKKVIQTQSKLNHRRKQGVSKKFLHLTYNAWILTFLSLLLSTERFLSHLSLSLSSKRSKKTRENSVILTYNVKKLSLVSYLESKFFLFTRTFFFFEPSRIESTSRNQPREELENVASDIYIYIVTDFERLSGVTQKINRENPSNVIYR